MAAAVVNIVVSYCAIKLLVVDTMMAKIVRVSQEQSEQRLVLPEA